MIKDLFQKEDLAALVLDRVVSFEENTEITVKALLINLIIKSRVKT